MERLTVSIAAAKRDHSADPRHHMTVGGYTKNHGAPTSIMVRLDGEKRWRRVYSWCFSNAGTCFLRIKGHDVVVSDCDIPEIVG